MQAFDDNFGFTPWLTPYEQEEVIRNLLRFGLLKWDNNRGLPLKSGGTTDIYVNLRDMRSHPEAMAYLARTFENPTRRLEVDRIAEVPQAVTPIAGPLSIALDKPLVTIRDQPKEGRVSDADIIGEIVIGDKVALFDDVIADGASKVVGYRAIKKRGGYPILVVLVDRQQGWQSTFADAGINMPVWDGMTLHDIRAYLISHGHMQRCDTETERRNQIIVGLDGMNWDEMLPLLEQLRTEGPIFKLGDAIIEAGLEQLVPAVGTYGRVMVDTKCHDTPKTVANIAARIAKYDPWAMTVHASGGRMMIEAAKEALYGTSTHILAVTVLTSIDKETGKKIYGRMPRTMVKKLADIAYLAGARGFVCSPHETEMLWREYPDCIIVNPGVRSPGVFERDQKRVATPEEAVRSGADYVVMASQLSDAPDPVAEFRRVRDEELPRVTRFRA